MFLLETMQALTRLDSLPLETSNLPNARANARRLNCSPAAVLLILSPQGFDDPEVMAAVSAIAADPTQFDKYKHNAKVQRFYAAMGMMMGEKLEKMAPPDAPAHAPPAATSRPHHLTPAAAASPSILSRPPAPEDQPLLRARPGPGAAPVPPPQVGRPWWGQSLVWKTIEPCCRFQTYDTCCFDSARAWVNLTLPWPFAPQHEDSDSDEDMAEIMRSMASNPFARKKPAAAAAAPAPPKRNPTPELSQVHPLTGSLHLNHLDCWVSCV